MWILYLGPIGQRGLIPVGVITSPIRWFSIPINPKTNPKTNCITGVKFVKEDGIWLNVIEDNIPIRIANQIVWVSPRCVRKYLNGGLISISGKLAVNKMIINPNKPVRAKLF